MLLEMSLPVRLKNSPSFCNLQQGRSAAYDGILMELWGSGLAWLQLGIPNIGCKVCHT